jgi:hypothetical protein
VAITKNNNVDFKQIETKDIDSDIIINFILTKCSSKKIYYVHNLTFEMFVFINILNKNNIKFKLVSSNKTIYSAEI